MGKDVIVESYTLFGRIPLFRDTQGRYATDVLWQRDLALHISYIQDFRICCPVEHVASHDRSLTLVEGLSDKNVFPLRLDRGWLSVFYNLLPNALSVLRALAKTEIAHSGGAGWAFPVSYYLLLFRAFLRFKWVVGVESSFFVKPSKGPVSLRVFFGHHVHGFLLRRCLRSADARFFTSEAYRDMFLGHREASLVAPAVWVDRADIISREALLENQRKMTGPVRILFPARLVFEKGVQTVLGALDILSTRNQGNEGASIEISIMGNGPEAQKCRNLAQRYAQDGVRFLEPRPYGVAFFEEMQNYDAVLIANLHDEQPRIIFDAFSQGVPCITSRTGGTFDLVTEGETGVFFEAGNPSALADKLVELCDQRSQLQKMGLKALEGMSERTHTGMHRRREKFIKDTLKLTKDRPDKRDHGDTVHETR